MQRPPARSGGGDRPSLLAIGGPTASGKTELAITLADLLGGEIVNADSRQVYRGMDIGTAKPTAAQRARVPHHLIDIVNPDETLSLVVFQSMAREAIEEIRGRGKLPVLVGGTGQYLRAVTDGWKPPEVHPNPRLRNELGLIAQERGGVWLHERLQGLDPEAAGGIDPRNVRRTIRALEVILTTGRTFSGQRGRSDSPYHLVRVGLRRPRPALYARIDQRIEAMFDGGLLEEVRGLLEKGYSANLPAMSAIGYRECVHVINGTWTIDEAKAAMRRATRIYVRRQSGWFKASDPHIRWFEAGDAGVVSAIAAYARAAIHDPGM